MAKNLVIVESPGKVKTIGKVLGKDYIVKASIGHIRDLPKGKGKGTDAKNLLVAGIAKDFTPTYVNVESKKKVIAELKKASSGVSKVYLCPDPDREGEAIAWHLAEALELSPEKIVRVTFDEITPRGIKAGFAAPRQIDMDLVNSQQARRVLDRIVGYKLSDLLWTKIVRGLSAGRVQSVAVRLLVEREKEIQAFIPECYWTVGANFSHANMAFEASLRAIDGKQVVSSADDLGKFKAGGQGPSGASGIVRTLIANKAEADSIAEALRKAKYAVNFYEVKEVQDRPYPPFATSQLQQAAANRLGFDAKRTMRVAQQLYEGVNLGAEGQVALITYMRTDSFRISPDALTECRAAIENLYGKKYLPEKPNFYSSRAGAQEAHECVRPTHVEMSPESLRSALSDEQYKLYRLIYQRFLACQMVPAVFDATTADIGASGPNTRNAVFRATGRVLKFDGWLAVQGGAAALKAAHVDASAADREKGDEIDSDETEAENATAAPAAAKKEEKKEKKPGSQILPSMKVGDHPKLERLDAEEHFTQPPPRYTEASLVKKLEREGIGRPSTYATILSTVQDRGYAQKLGQGGRGSFMATPLGRVVTESLEGHFPSIMDLGFTREMETELDKVEEAHLDWRKAIADFYGPFSRDLAAAAKNMPNTKQISEPTDVKCPDCGSPMEKRLSQYGFYLRCSRAPECKATYRLDAQGNIQKKEGPKPTGLKCDLCGSDVVRSVGRFGAYLHCVNYTDKKCTFTMKLNKENHPLRKFAALPTDVKCEKCKSPMVVRVTSRGKTRRPFLSCSNFPKCRAAMDLPPELAELGEKAMDQWYVIDAKNKHDLPIYQSYMAAQEKEEQAAAPAEE